MFGAGGGGKGYRSGAVGSATPLDVDLEADLRSQDDRGLAVVLDRRAVALLIRAAGTTLVAVAMRFRLEHPCMRLRPRLSAPRCALIAFDLVARFACANT